jgi:hypothetical protein
LCEHENIYSIADVQTFKESHEGESQRHGRPLPKVGFGFLDAKAELASALTPDQRALQQRKFDLSGHPTNQELRIEIHQCLLAVVMFN